MLNQTPRVAAAEPKSRPSSMPAPRVSVRLTGAGPAIEPALGEAATSDAFRATFLSAFGTVDELVAEALFTQLLNSLHTEPGKPVDSAMANLALALMHEVGPSDVVEAMLGCQMIIAHVAAMDASRRALHAEQTAAGRATDLSLGRKLMTLFTAQMDALNRHRGKATVQKVIVEKVLVAPGGQAIVGAVANGGPGDGDNLGGQPHDGRSNPFDRLPRCGAKNRRGGTCGRVGNAQNGRCDLHGGRSPGAPRGELAWRFPHPGSTGRATAAP